MNRMLSRPTANMELQRRYWDRDPNRVRDWSRGDRRDYEQYRSAYRDSPRERPRSRDGVRERRDRSRDHRHRREISRDRDRRRRDDSAESRRSVEGKDNRDRVPSRDVSDKKEVRLLRALEEGKLIARQALKSASSVADEEEKKTKRLAKLEAWKQKQQKAAAEKRQKEQLQSAAATRGLPEEIDKKAAVSPGLLASPKSTAQVAEPATPLPYAGKFDPKAIAKKATSTVPVVASRLGTDILLPDQNKAFAFSTPYKSTLNADKIIVLDTSSSGTSYTIILYLNNPNLPVRLASSVPLKVRGNLSGFGLAGKLPQESDRSTTKKRLDFGEEEKLQRKLEKLPTPPLSIVSGTLNEDAALANSIKKDEDDEDIDIEDATEEVVVTATRAAAERREEHLQARNIAYRDPHSHETTTSEGVPIVKDTKMEDFADPLPVGSEEIHDDIDPLDAFMADLNGAQTARSKLSFRKKPTHKAEAIYGDDIELHATSVDQGEDFFAITKKKKKEIPTVDHTKIDYKPLQKDVYIVPSDPADLTEEQVSEMRFELEDIKTKGTKVPPPAMSWSHCGLGIQVQDVVDSLGYGKPTPVVSFVSVRILESLLLTCPQQAQTIPCIMSGRDLVGIAKTGSGKTMAFCIAMMRNIKAQRPLSKLDGPIGLVLAPTRELATQIHRDCKPFLKALNLRALCAYGGASIKDQIAQLKTGAHIVVCTPGRMIDLLAANAGRVTNLRRVTYLVLDEADRMFDMGFEPQVMKILANIRPDRQTVLFSATFPRQMEGLAKKTLAPDPCHVIIGGRSVVAPEITQIVEVREESTKFLRLLELLGKQYEDESNDDHTLIFVERQEMADTLLRDLMRKGYYSHSLHGGKDQDERNENISSFKAGVILILIATSVASRGLDVKQLRLVVNYSAPSHLEDYGAS